MESFSLAVGLAGLFSTCLDCFHLVQTGRYLGRDYLILETKYSNQRLRLSAWGRACGFIDDNNPGGCSSPLQWSKEVYSAVEETLDLIATLFKDHQILSRRYGLSSGVPADAVRPLVLGLRALGSLTRRLRPPATKRSITGVQAAVRWAIVDKDKFSDLVTHLKDFIDNLENMTSDTVVPRRQRRFIQFEVETICEESELEDIEQARMDGRDPVADAASLRLSQLQETGRMSPDEPAADIAVDWDVVHPVTARASPPTDSYDNQILHRVSCNLEQTALFLDKPSYTPETSTKNQWLVVDTDRPLSTPAALHLSGTRPLHDLDSYLEQNTQLWWLVLKDYTCCHDTRHHRDAEPLTTSIRLTSQELCDELNAIKFLRRFAPGMELKAPHDWFYHDPRFTLRRKPRFQGARPTPVSSLPAERLLRFIEDSMAEKYQDVSGWMGSTRLSDISRELLPLIFRPGKSVIEKHPDGDDDFRAYEQAQQLPRLVPASGLVPEEVLEIPVQIPVPEQASTLQIRRSVFEDAKRRHKCLDDLPILPANLESGCNDGYLHNRGSKFYTLTQEPQAVEYLDEAGKINGQYFVDMSTYDRIGINCDPSEHPAARIESHQNPPYWLWSEDGFDEEYYRDDWWSDGEEDAFEKENREYGNTLLAPHAVHGFHLVDHVWRKLLLRNIQLASDVAVDLSPEDLQTGSHLMFLFQELLMPMRRSEWCVWPYFYQLEHLRKIVVSVQGPFWEAGVALVSRMTRRALYRLRLSGQTENLNGVFETTKTLNRTWGCIIVIEDIVEATSSRSTLSEKAAIIRSVLPFLDSHNGIVIFAVPARTQLDPMLAQRVSMNFDFQREDLILNKDCRRRLWEQRIGDRFVLDDDNESLLEMATSLAAWEMTEEEIQSILDIVLAPGQNDDKPDWEALTRLLHHRLSLHSTKPKKEEDRTESQQVTSNQATDGLGETLGI